MDEVASKETIRITVADDHALFREGLRRILQLEEDIEIVGEAKDGAEALELVSKLKPDVILMDISLPGPDGIRITRQIKKRTLSCYLCTRTQHILPNHFRQVLLAT